MNIVVFGGGEPGKFGNDFCRMARREGHNVFILSHKDYANGDPQHMHTECRERQYVVEDFNRLTESIDHIDIFLYNGRMDGYPGWPEHFKSTAKVSSDMWYNNLHFTVILPHILSIEALKKMSEGSKIVFLTTGLATELDRTKWTELAGYAGLKAAQNHLMIALANHNDRGAFVCSISPHFPYEDRNRYNIVCRKVYENILGFNSKQNGKIKVIH
jgi:hypothetical protein